MTHSTMPEGDPKRRDVSDGSIEDAKVPEEIQEQALNLGFEEFQAGVMDNELLLGAVCSTVMAEVAGEDTSDLPEFTIVPYQNDTEFGMYMCLSAVKRLESSELPVALNFAFTRLCQLAVFAHKEGMLDITRQFGDTIVGRPLSKENPPTDEQRARVFEAANAYRALIVAFDTSCRERGVEYGYAPGGMPTLTSKLDRTYILPERDE